MNKKAKRDTRNRNCQQLSNSANFVYINSIQAKNYPKRCLVPTRSTSWDFPLLRFSKLK